MINHDNSDMKTRQFKKLDLRKWRDILNQQVSLLASLRSYPSTELQHIGANKWRLCAFNPRSVECIEQVFELPVVDAGLGFTAITPIYKALSANLDILFADWSTGELPTKPISSTPERPSADFGHVIFYNDSEGNIVNVEPQVARDEHGNFVRSYRENGNGNAA